MADNVEIVFAAHNLPEVEFRDQNSLTFQIRARQKVSEWIDDATPSPANHLVRAFPENRPIVRRKTTSTIELIAREHEAPPLDSDVAHRGQPRVAGYRRSDAIDLD